MFDTHALKAGISLRGLPLNPPARKQKSPPYNARPWSRSPFMRACAGPEPGSNLPHGTRRVCRARRMRDANGNAAQTGGLARQVRQRMNRLGKPEHRARFCFFSKKKSLAGMRRFPITLEIQIPMGFNCGTLNPCSPKNPSPITALRRRLHHRARRNYRRITPRYPRPPAGALRHHTPSSHRICRPLGITAHLGAAPIARMRRARAGFQSAARCAKRVPRPPPGGANRNAAQTGGFGAASAAKDEPAREARAPRALLPPGRGDSRSHRNPDSDGL